MPRNISFTLTTQQFRDRTKTVTRRMGWSKLGPGVELMGCVKCMGMKPGEAVERLGLIRVTSVRRERLDLMYANPDYGKEEVVKEGFPKLTSLEFITMFCNSMRCIPSDYVTRIEFEYVEIAAHG